MDEFDEIAEQQGWDETDQLALMKQYIENQKSDEAFRDFVLEQIGLTSETR